MKLSLNNYNNGAVGLALPSKHCVNRTFFGVDEKMIQNNFQNLINVPTICEILDL